MRSALGLQQRQVRVGRVGRPNLLLSSAHVEFDLSPAGAALNVAKAADRSTPLTLVLSYIESGSWGRVWYKFQGDPGLTPVTLATKAEFAAHKAASGSVRIFGFGWDGLRANASRPRA